MVNRNAVTAIIRLKKQDGSQIGCNFSTVLYRIGSLACLSLVNKSSTVDLRFPIDGF